METKSNTLTATEFFEKLQHNELEALVPFSITGMVKKADGKEKAIEFSSGGHCSHWVTIPLEFIEDVKVLKIVTCKDHTHPLVKLNLKAPKSSDGKVFFALLEGMQQRFEKLEHRMDNVGPPNYPAPSSYYPPTTSRSARSPRIFSQPGGFGGDGGGGLHRFGDCPILEYQCHCVEWEHPNFGVYICVREECDFVCKQRP
jgi:hypothetical protein